jgi:hypothetical protein
MKGIDRFMFYAVVLLWGLILLAAVIALTVD